MLRWHMFRLRHSTDLEVKRAAIAALGRSKNIRAIPLLQGELFRSRRDVGAWLRHGLPANDCFSESLAALRAFGKEALVPLAETWVFGIYNNAGYPDGLRTQEIELALDALDKNWPQSRQIYRRFFEAGNRELEECAISGKMSSWTRYAATKLIGRMGDVQAGQSLVRILAALPTMKPDAQYTQQPDERVETTCVEYLGRIGYPTDEAAAAVMGRFRPVSHFVDAIGRLRYVPAIPSLIPLIFTGVGDSARKALDAIDNRWLQNPIARKSIPALAQCLLRKAAFGGGASSQDSVQIETMLLELDPNWYVSPSAGALVSGFIDILAGRMRHLGNHDPTACDRAARLLDKLCVEWRGRQDVLALSAELAVKLKQAASTMDAEQSRRHSYGNRNERLALSSAIGQIGECGAIEDLARIATQDEHVCLIAMKAMKAIATKSLVGASDNELRALNNLPDAVLSWIHEGERGYFVGEPVESVDCGELRRLGREELRRRNHC